MLILHVLQGPDAGKRIPLPPGEPQLIGRSTEAITIHDQSVSRRHAELTPDDGSWWLRDLDSQNGTFVNGRPVFDRVALKPGDRIRCGDTLLVVAAEVDLPETEEPRAAEPQVSAVEARLPSSAPIVADPRFRLMQEMAALGALATAPDRLIERTLRMVVDEFGADAAAYVGAERRTARATFSRGGHGAPTIARTAVDEALRSGEGLLLGTAEASGGTASSALCVAVRAPDSVFGVLWIERELARGAFDERHLRLLQAVGLHMGLVLRHGELAEAAIARERLAAMGETVAALSHSIKNILQAMRGGADAVELALSRGDLALAREGWPILGRNLDRIYSLTQNMLVWAKERALDLEPFSPNALVQDVAALLASAAARRRARLELSLDEGMPPVTMDPHAMHQALVNLVANALEAVPERTGVVTIATAWRVADASAEIRISDNGHGIPDSLRERLFEPFASTKGQRGTGLGLAVTRKIVERHGGQVRVATTGPNGTEMTILLPDRAPPERSDETRAPQSVTEDDLGIEFGEPEGEVRS